MDASLPLQIAYGIVFLLLVAVTLGIGYLTVADWQDRRRREKLTPKKSSPRRPRR
ncbi:MAG: hypothetical protein Q6K99_04535 [Thermostichales cyanobacterium BF4_bins_65]